MTILLARHGETDWNTWNRVLGRTDIPLNTRGYEQAEALTALLSDRKIDAVYSSPLQRAHWCASLVAQRHRVPCITEERLIEMDFGVFEGVARDDKAYQREKRNVFSRYPGGESYLQVAGRVYPFLEELKFRHPNGTVLLVTHNGVSRVIGNYFMDMSAEAFFSFALGNCEIREYCM